MTLYFDTAQLAGGVRRSHVHVKSAVLRLHWTGHLPPRRSRPKQAATAYLLCAIDGFALWVDGAAQTTDKAALSIGNNHDDLINSVCSTAVLDYN